MQKIKVNALFFENMRGEDHEQILKDEVDHIRQDVARQKCDSLMLSVSDGVTRWRHAFIEYFYET